VFPDRLAIVVDGGTLTTAAGFVETLTAALIDAPATIVIAIARDGAALPTDDELAAWPRLRSQARAGGLELQDLVIVTDTQHSLADLVADDEESDHGRA